MTWLLSVDGIIQVAAWGAVAVLVLLAVDMHRGMRRLRRLADIAPVDADRAPALSVIVAARNEQRHIEEALQSLLVQDYPALEIVVVNDRSTDRTGEILDVLCARFPRLRVVSVEELPPGWLGKNHALALGARRASGDYLLFTDADVVMEPTALRRAMRFMLDAGLDNLAATPAIPMREPLLKIAVTAFFFLFAGRTRPWKARHPSPRWSAGIGAFNLVRRSVYEAVGGHAAIALRPDDDYRFGRLIKERGFRQDILLAREMLSVEWYASTREMIAGLRKNLFAGCDYNLPQIILITLELSWLFGAPLAAAILVPGVGTLTAAAIAILAWASTPWAYADFRGLEKLYPLFLPVGVLIFLVALWNSTLTTLARGGIEWRGTFYPLRELKSGGMPSPLQ